MPEIKSVGILTTMRRDGQPGCEYRVACSQEFWMIKKRPDYPSFLGACLNREATVRIFGDHPVHFNLDKAREVANYVLQKNPDADKNICTFYFPKIIFPASGRQLRSRDWHRRRHQP